MRLSFVLASAAVLCHGECDVLHLSPRVREQVNSQSYLPHPGLHVACRTRLTLRPITHGIAAGGASASKAQDTALDACGLPTDYRQTSHCFADSTHHTCCMLGPEGTETTKFSLYPSDSGHPIVHLIVEHAFQEPIPPRCCGCPPIRWQQAHIPFSSLCTFPALTRSRPLFALRSEAIRGQLWKSYWHGCQQGFLRQA